MARVKDSTAARVRQRVLKSEDSFWRVEDFEGEPHAVVMELRRLAEAGEVERVRRGVFWRGRSTRFGMNVPPAVMALRELAGDREAVGAAEWYATNALGLSTQVSPEPVVSITSRPPTGLRGVKVINRTGKRGRREARLNDLEVTLLEALEGWEKYVEVDDAEATERFVDVLRRPEVRVDRLARAASTESPVVRERLRAVLEAGGWDDHAQKVDRARSRSARARAHRVLPTSRDAAPSRRS
jgi:hypothetical protein